jgi:hypothetical protein
MQRDQVKFDSTTYLQLQLGLNPRYYPTRPLICAAYDWTTSLARVLLDSYQFYPENHRHLVRDHVGHARPHIADAIDLVYGLRSAL